MYNERLQHLQTLARQLTIMLAEAEKQQATEAVIECKRQLTQIENEVKRIKKLRPYKREK